MLSPDLNANAPPTSPDFNREIHQRRVAQNTPSSATNNTTAYPDYGPPVDSTLLPAGSRSFSFIGVQAWWLGNTFSGGLLFTIYLLSTSSTWWRLPAFFACLSLFHFLEYYTTARYNIPATRASSFLLFNNGSAYTTAHGLATLEIVLSNFSSKYQLLIANPLIIAVGLILIVIGQTTRSIAMAHAGTNFNHTIARERKVNHILVKDGIYAHLRHPSYFGFFWWALGTQLLVGNKVCLVGYTVVLWRFFARRIYGESGCWVQ
jgi:protein-S-isoprenylcysteine O-methyltransferase